MAELAGWLETQTAEDRVDHRHRRARHRGGWPGEGARGRARHRRRRVRRHEPHRAPRRGRLRVSCSTTSRGRACRQPSLAAGHVRSARRRRVADICDRWPLRRALGGVAEVYHFAAQVAVTTSLDEPRRRLPRQRRGTLRLLEEIRRLDEPPFLLFTSTNKVYGTLPDLALERTDQRWQPRRPGSAAQGLSEACRSTSARPTAARRAPPISTSSTTRSRTASPRSSSG